MARIEIDEALSASQLDIPAARTTSRRTERFAWASALLLVGVAAVATTLLVVTRRPESPVSEVRFEIQTPPTTDPWSLAISPDGQKIIFVATSEGRSKLWLRRLDSAAAEPLAGTDGAAAPFWSPDSRSVAFFTSTDNRLKRLDVDGRSMQVLGTLFGIGGTLNRDGTILFSSLGGPSSLFRVSSNGGPASAVAPPRPPEIGHLPQFLPDGRHFLFFSPNSTASTVFAGDLNGSEPRRLLEADTAATYVPSGHVVFGRGGTLFAQVFDADRLVLIGSPFRVAAQPASWWAPALSLCALSTPVYGVRAARMP